MLVVQKFGGTSVGDLERIKNVAQKVKKAKEKYDKIVVVVSAMSGETNKLIEYGNYYTEYPNEREMDVLLSSGERVTSSLLAIALNSIGVKAISLSGREAGLITNTEHTKARIHKLDGTRVQKELDSGKVVVVAGFQGVSTEGETTTLGRGGSDLSAVALAGALKADLCEIYTDVDGVYTTDPRIEPRARKLDFISYEEMLELASLGAKVLLNRSVELAKKLNVKLVTRSSFNDNEGTIITSEESMEQAIVSGIALDKNQARVTLRKINDKPGIAADIFSLLASKNINVDMIIQNVGHDGTTNLGFTVPQNELNLAKEVLNDFLDSGTIESDSEIVKVSIVGVGMKSHSGVAAAAFKAMADENINIQMISTSEIKISIIVHEKYGELAVRALHKTYKLDQDK